MSDDVFILDLTNYKNKFGDRVPEGDYTVIVEDVEKDTSSKGNPMLNIWLRIVGGDFDGATIVDRLTDTENAKFRWVMFMQALNLPTPRAKIQIKFTSLIGKRLMVNVGDGEPYMNRVKSEVRGYMAAEGGPSAPVTDLDDVQDSGLGEFAPSTTTNPGNGTAAAAAAPAAAAAAAPAAAAAVPEDLIEVSEINLDEIDL